MNEIFSRIKVSGRQVAAVVVFVIVAAVAQMAIPSLLGTMINAQLAAGVKPFDALVSSGVSRLRPVFNTSLTTVLGMMPLVADPFYSAMAVTIMGGLAFATLLTMVVVPVNYAILYRVKRTENAA